MVRNVNERSLELQQDDIMQADRCNEFRIYLKEIASGAFLGTLGVFVGSEE